MKPLPENWVLFKNINNDFVFSNTQGSHFVHIDYEEGVENHYKIYFVQNQRDFMVIGIENEGVLVSSTTQMKAMEKAIVLMECIDDYLLIGVKNFS